MQAGKKLGVFLKDTPADDAVLAFAAHFATVQKNAVVCVHVRNTAPGEPQEAPTLEAVEQRVKAALPSEVHGRLTCEVHAGSGLDEILRTAKDQDFDLIIVGRRLPSSQMGIGAKFTRIVRKSPCSVLVVPEHCRPHFGRVLVAVDESEHSRLALLAAMLTAKQSGEPHPQLIVQTVRHVDPRFNLAGVSFEESAAKQREYGQRDLDQLLSSVDTKGVVNVETVVTLAEDPAESIAELATVRKMDVVVVGSRGTTRSAAMLLGSTSERVLMACAMPVLIVKEKGETLNLLEALLSM